VRRSGKTKFEGLGDIKELARQEFPEYFYTEEELSEKETKIKGLLEFYYKMKNALCKMCILFKPDMPDKLFLGNVYLGALDHYDRMRFD
jgi:hypothetical protein